MAQAVSAAATVTAGDACVGPVGRFAEFGERRTAAQARNAIAALHERCEDLRFRGNKAKAQPRPQRDPVVDRIRAQRHARRGWRNRFN